MAAFDRLTVMPHPAEDSQRRQQHQYPAGEEYAFGSMPTGWSTWISRAVPDDAESGGGLLVATIQLGLTVMPHPAEDSQRRQQHQYPAGEEYATRTAQVKPTGWSTWISRAVPDDAESGGGLLVATIQLAITVGVAEAHQQQRGEAHQQRHATEGQRYAAGHQVASQRSMPTGWSTWISRAVPDDAESGGGLLVATIQLAITVKKAAQMAAFDRLTVMPHPAEDSQRRQQHQYPAGD
jgi:hypothetical protein